MAIAEVLVSDAGRISALPSRQLTRVSLIDADGAPLDEALCVVMRGPRSYTGEDVVELSCHGSPAVLRAVMSRLCAAGARLADPGEFTRRAFLNGRIDLARAEAVALLVSARTERAARLAARALSRFGDEAARLRDALIDLVAGLEVRLDFPEDTVGLPEMKAADIAMGLADTVDAWRRAGELGRVVHEGLCIALVGAPNAGKSTLMNALVGQERAIVSSVPGTTRDVVESTIVISGVPVRLLDTAGLGEPRDAIDAEAMRRTRKAIDASDFAVVVIDTSAAMDETALSATASKERVVVGAKSDLPSHPAMRRLADAVRVSAMEGTGLDALRQRLQEFVRARAGEDGDEGELVVSLRQRELLSSLSDALRRGARMSSGAPLELALVDFRDALAYASELLGVGVGDVVLDRVFASFCLGK